jgi:hypothetical protein
MTLKSDLTAARALIDTPEKWRKDGEVLYDSCCAVIAVTRIVDAMLTSAWGALYRELPTRFHSSSWYTDAIGDFNDDPATTHADVLSLFDRAIAAAGDA